MPTATPRVVLVEDHTMVRQLFGHLIKQELGLKLAAGKAPVDVLVVESITRPTEN